MTKARHIIVFTVAAAVLVAGLLSASAGGDKKDNGGGAASAWDRAAYEREVAQSRASLGPQSAYLAGFNQGKRDYTQLRVVEMDASISPMLPVEESLAAANIVALATVTSVEFGGSGMSDIPMMTIRYRALADGRGVLQGGELALRVVGGPYSFGNGGEGFLVLPSFEPPVVGQRYLLMLNQRAAGLEIPSPGAVLRVGAGDAVAETKASTASGAAGRGVAALLAAAP